MMADAVEGQQDRQPEKFRSVLTGLVTTVEGVAIAGAEVAVGSDALTAQTDSTGRFRIIVGQSGLQAVRLRRIGYKPQLLRLDVKDGHTLDVHIVLERGIAELPELAVSARLLKPIEYGFTTRYDDFFRRRAVGFGKFVTRGDIDRMKPYRTPNLLAGIAGIRLRFYGLGPTGTAVEFSRCEAVGVWIDGVRQTLPVADPDAGGGVSGRALGELLQNVIPSQIELMEVYRGPSELPAEFNDNACAAIVIWTR